MHRRNGRSRRGASFGRDHRRLRTGGKQIAVKWASLPFPSDLVAGRDLVRHYFLRGEHDFVFGTSHSLMFRADLVRAQDPFFNEFNLHADTEVCVDLLRRCDFSFVHQVLTFRRDRTGSATEYATRMNTSVGCRLYELVTYGPDFLSAAELESCRKRVLDEYYNYLGLSSCGAAKKRISGSYTAISWPNPGCSSVVRAWLRRSSGAAVGRCSIPQKPFIKSQEHNGFE